LIALISDTNILVWDFERRPALRACINLPQKVELVTFLPDRFALVVQDRLFILRLSMQPDGPAPFTVGSKCFLPDMSIDFGLSGNRTTRNSMFVVRSPLDPPADLEILQTMMMPGKIRSIRWLPGGFLLVLTSEAIIECVPGDWNNGTSTYLPRSLLKFARAASPIDFAFNADFVLPFDQESVRFFPNPERSRFWFADGSFVELGVITLKRIQFVCVNSHYCVVLTNYGPAGSLYVLKFEPTDVLAAAALRSPIPDLQKAGLRLAPASDVVATAFSLGLKLLRDDTVTAVQYLTEAFNSPAISERQRDTIFEAVMAVTPRSRREHFILHADFRARHITADVVKALRSIKPSRAARKLIRASRFDVTADFGDDPEGVLFAAASASLSGDHDRARLMFSGVSDQSLFALIDPEVLRKISTDLRPEVLVVVGHPELPNGEWTVDERIAARHFLEGNMGECLAVAAGKMGEVWHFEQWPKQPRLVDWMDGGPMMEFAAGCLADNDINEVPEVFASVAQGVRKAEDGEWAAALAAVGDSVYRIGFLREFVRAAKGWMSVIEQVDDEEVKRCAFHFLIREAPKNGFGPGTDAGIGRQYVDILGQLAQADQALVLAVAVG
jgi:hypothetical protein